MNGLLLLVTGTAIDRARASETRAADALARAHHAEMSEADLAHALETSRSLHAALLTRRENAKDRKLALPNDANREAPTHASASPETADA